MAREWSERHIRELIERYSTRDNGGDEGAHNDELFPFVLKAITSLSGGSVGIYLLDKIDKSGVKKAIMLMPGNSISTNVSYEWPGSYTGKRSVQYYMPNTIELTYWIRFVTGFTNYEVYALGNKINEIPCDSIENRKAWWDANKGASVGTIQINNPSYGLIGTTGQTLSTIANPVIRDMCIVTNDTEFSGSNLAAEINLNYGADATNTWPRP